MEGATFKNDENPIIETADCGDFILSFGNFGLGKDGTLRLGSTTGPHLPNVNGGSSSSANHRRVNPNHDTGKDCLCRDQEDMRNPFVYTHPETSDTITPSFLNYTSVKQTPNPWACVAETSVSNSSSLSDSVLQRNSMTPDPAKYPECQLNSWVYDQDGISGCIPTFPFDSFNDYQKYLAENSFLNRGKKGFVSNTQNHGFLGFQDNNVDGEYSQYYLAGSSRTYLSSVPGFYIQYGPSFAHTGLDNFSWNGEDNHIWSGIESESFMNCNNLMSFEQWQREKENIQVLKIMGKCGSASREHVPTLLKGKMSLIFQERMYLYFIKLLDFFSDKNVNERIPELLSDSQVFISAAFCKQGSMAIVKLIKRVKKMDLAFSVAKVLSTRFYHLVTHPIARFVIQQCLNIFGNGPNEILYDQVINQFQALATHEVGCRSLNECIDTISGDQRTKLLDSIADISDYLSKDLYGNYVVQLLLTLKDEHVTSRILNRLKGQFYNLSLRKGGSHVVEKCIEFSDIGTVLIVQEILEMTQGPFLLAQDKFRNYVIQKALEKTKTQGYSSLYISLVRALEPYRSQLNCSTGGKRMLSFLRKEIQLKRQGSVKWKALPKVEAKGGSQSINAHCLRFKNSRTMYLL